MNDQGVDRPADASGRHRGFLPGLFPFAALGLFVRLFLLFRRIDGTVGGRGIPKFFARIQVKAGCAAAELEEDLVTPCRERDRPGPLALSRPPPEFLAVAGLDGDDGLLVGVLRAALPRRIDGRLFRLG